MAKRNKATQPMTADQIERWLVAEMDMFRVSFNRRSRSPWLAIAERGDRIYGGMGKTKLAALRRLRAKINAKGV